jgi:hypothetical protein
MQYKINVLKEIKFKLENDEWYLARLKGDDTSSINIGPGGIENLIKFYMNFELLCETPNLWKHTNNLNTDIYEHRDISICPFCNHQQIGDTKYCCECGSQNMI